MRLSRTGTNIPFEDSDEYEAEGREIDGADPDAWMANVMFYRFGNAPERRPKFEVDVRWPDIERVIQKFCEISHPAAERLQRDRQLAKLIDTFIRSPTSK